MLALDSLFTQWSIDPVWIQAYTNITLTALSLLTLIVLCIYAADTRKIARASVMQIENAQMPFLALLHHGAFEATGWSLQNQGNSAVINIDVTIITFCQLYKNSPDEVLELRIDPILQGGECTLQFGRTGFSFKKCTVKYQSLDGRNFITTVSAEKGKSSTTFKRHPNQQAVRTSWLKSKLLVLNRSNR